MAVAVPSRRRLRSQLERSGRLRTGEASGWLLAGIVLLGALIRFTTLGEQSFWADEATTHGIVAQGLGHVLSTIPRSESTPPMYYVLLWLWSRAFGLGEVGLRSFSALCGTLTIAVVWAIGRQLVSERVGLVAALLSAVNPFLFWYSQEARSYSLLLLLGAITLLALVRSLEQPSRGRVLAWGALSAAALSAHYFAAFVVAPEAAWLLIALHRRGRLTPRIVALGIGPAAAMGVALAPLVIRQNDGRASYISTSSGSLPHRVAQLVKQDVIGDGQPVKVLLGLIGCGLVLLGVALLLRRASRKERSAALLPLAVGVGGVLIALVISAIATDYFNTRNMLATWPALALVLAIGLGSARAGRLGTVGIGGLVALSLFCISNVVLNPAWQRDNWRGAARALGPVTAPRAIVADLVGYVPLQPYLRGLSSYPTAGKSVQEVDLIWLGRGAYGAPLIPIALVALPGFPSVQEIRTSSYLVVRYRASAPRFEPPAALNRLYPSLPRALSLLQVPS